MGSSWARRWAPSGLLLGAFCAPPVLPGPFPGQVLSWKRSYWLQGLRPKSARTPGFCVSVAWGSPKRFGGHLSNLQPVSPQGKPHLFQVRRKPEAFSNLPTASPGSPCSPQPHIHGAGPPAEPGPFNHPWDEALPPPASCGLDARGSQEPPFGFHFGVFGAGRAFWEGAKALGGVGGLISELKEEPGSSARCPWGWKRGSHPAPVSWARGEGWWGSHGAGFRWEQGTRWWHPWHGHGRLHRVVGRALRTEREARSLHHPPARKTCVFLRVVPPRPSPWRRRTLASGPAGSPELPPRDANVAAGGNAATADAGNDFTERTQRAPLRDPALRQRPLTPAAEQTRFPKIKTQGRVLKYHSLSLQVSVGADHCEGDAPRVREGSPG